ncbi:hypothetical protein Mapa_013785 [Marchantia paleacea]|nr:hypothetical protein Mapa_013785 [Marchantia paleacea]
MALTVQMQLIDSKLPYCAFNGGNGKLNMVKKSIASSSVSNDCHLAKLLVYR